MTATAISSVLLIVIAFNILTTRAQPFANAGEFPDSKTYLTEKAHVVTYIQYGVLETLYNKHLIIFVKLYFKKN